VVIAVKKALKEVSEPDDCTTNVFIYLYHYNNDFIIFSF